MIILIVDDNALNLKLLRAQLEGEGHAVIQAADGVEALEMLNAKPVDLLISDILMPRMDGYRLCTEIRKSKTLATLPIIVYTATYTSPSDEKLSLSLGADLYMRKPASVEEIKQAISTLAKKGSRQGLSGGGVTNELEKMTEYSEALVNKLEENFLQLGTAHEELRESEERYRSLYESAQKRLGRTMALREIDNAISSSLDLKFTLEVVLTQVVNELQVDAADILLYDQDKRRLEFFVGKGFRTPGIEGTQLPADKGFAGRAIAERKRIDVSDLRENTKDFFSHSRNTNDDFVDFHVAPLIAKDVVVGLMGIFKRTTFNASPEWLDYFETLAGQAAIAIDNISLFDDLQVANKQLVLGYAETIEGWSRALDLRDKETEGHTQRVTALTLKLAKSLGLSEQSLVQVQRGALLHDIGKMGVPDSILLKPDTLTEHEWEIMRQHPVNAFQLLSPISYLQDALDIPFCHHEKWDGSGYPQGLKGEKIPFTARLFAVIDVYDALTSDRPYRKAWPREKAIAHIEAESGKHFDPQVVSAFLGHIVGTQPVPVGGQLVPSNM